MRARQRGKRRLAAALALGAGALGLVLAWGWSRRARTEVSAPAGDGGIRACRLHVDDQLAFQVHSTSRARGGEAAHGADDVGVELEAVMHWRVLATRGAGWLIAGALDAATLRPAGELRPGDLEEPFLIDLGRDCRFKSLAFGPRVAAGARPRIEALLGSLEVVLPALPVQKWTARQRDPNGAYTGHYAVEAKGGAISRRRSGYLHAAAAPGAPLGSGPQMKIERSSAHATLAAGGRWLTAFSSDEQLELSLADRPVAQVAVQIELRQIDRAAPARLQGLAVEQFVWGGSASAPQPARATVKAPDAALAALDLAGALQDFAQRLGRGKAGLDNAVEALAGYLAQRPEAITQLMARLRAGGIDAKIHSALFLALELTGTAHAERALAGAIEDRGLADVNRMRAAVALADVAHPSQRAVDALVTGAQLSGVSDDRDVATTSLLALGTLGHNAATSQPQLAASIRDELSTRLARGGGNSDVAATLDAAGNAGDPALWQAVAPYTTHASALVRVHAAGAYRRSSDTAGEAALLTWLQREQQPTVRRAIVASLAERVKVAGGDPSPALLAAAIARLPLEADPQTRGTLIKLLGGVADTMPAAKRALIEQFHREPDPRLQQQIGQYCSADDLA